ncbi:helix-turn-helix domain-containing protein [Ruminococcaceae bacterium OttesenSCG-928-D13]|nr:helix-turn-helix domain-containing protein [Ruminococcaceae bacterium OttesenSCG-928-D13]
MSFAKRLKATRKAAGLSQETISGLCEISRRAWSKYESGQWMPKLDKLVKIADHLAVSTDFLLGRTEEHKNINV